MSRSPIPLSRRSFIGIATSGLAGLTTGSTDSSNLQAALATQARRAQAKNVLVIFEQGGISHTDTWDPKPKTNPFHRSPFKPISTSVPGMHFTELLSRTAQVAHKLTVVRCMRQPKPNVGNSHPMGSQYIFSGSDPTGPVTLPDIGSVVSQQIGTSARYLPAYVLEGSGEQSKESRLGFLPASHKAFKIRHGRVSGLKLEGISPQRLRKRRDLLANLNIGLLGNAPNDVRAMEQFSAQAEDMLTNPATLAAFDLSGEPDSIKRLYHPNEEHRTHRGDLYLLGRKLIESGVRFVTINTQWPSDGNRWPGGGNMNWDHHDAIYSQSHTNIKGGGAGSGRWGIGTWPMMQSTDWAFSGLIKDMDQRGLLDETLICFVTEFGRTPKVNERQGRDHWVHAFSIVFAGAGVPEGQVVGQTDQDGAYVTSPMAYTVEDYGATVYAKLGIDVSEPILTPENRPIFLAKGGRAIPEVFA
ncbi:MAG: DUF1501 domain-containing protein [Planctomycetaceae bacterium]|nr:DUF1501 domain-containing protein [Planctomycetaceae bacterium]